MGAVCIQYNLKERLKLVKGNIKNWYQSRFRSDELGNTMNPNATFFGLLMDLKHVYEYLNVYDSLIRERVFTKLAEILDVDYDDIYNAWVK